MNSKLLLYMRDILIEEWYDYVDRQSVGALSYVCVDSCMYLRWQWCRTNATQFCPRGGAIAKRRPPILA